MKVSIIIPAYTSEEFIASAIDSVLSHTYSDIECIVVDPGLSDRTSEIIRGYSGTVTVLADDSGAGVFAALNTGIKAATGDIIGWLGADELYADPDVIEKAVQAIEMKGVDMCWGDLAYIDRHDSKHVLRFWKSSPYTKGAFARGWQLPQSASFIKKSIFERYGYFNTDFTIAADYELFLRLLEKHTFATHYVSLIFVKRRTDRVDGKSLAEIIAGNKECYRAWAVNGLPVNPLRVFVPKLFGKVPQYVGAQSRVEKMYRAKNRVLRALVLGGGGFIGSHLVRRLKTEGYFVRAADLRKPEFSRTAADEFVVGDLRDQSVCRAVLDGYFDEVYQLAADMGGAGYIFTGDHDADVMHNSASINLNIVELAREHAVGKIFYSSSACMYPAYNQEDPENPNCAESSAYPAAPDSEYGWEKLFSERVYLSYARNYGLSVRIARFHNIFGPESAWRGGREKGPAAICRKVAEARDGGAIEIWGDGFQTRSFLYIDECIEGMRRFMASDFPGPLNIGSDEMVTINQLAEMAAEISGKKLAHKHIAGPLGVRGRNSDNTLIQEKLGWAPSASLRAGMEKTYAWIVEQIAATT